MFEQLLTRIEILEEDRSKPVQAEVCSPSPTLAEPRLDAQQGAGQEEENERAAGCMEKGEKREEALRMDVEMIKREKAALLIQTNWGEHRNRVGNSNMYTLAVRFLSKKKKINKTKTQFFSFFVSNKKNDCLNFHGP